MLARIRALLAKAEATEFAEEAEALSARAQQLMAKYSIDHALLARRVGRARRRPAAGGSRWTTRTRRPKVTLLQTVAAANRGRVVWSKELGLVTVIGFPADLDAVELLFTSLLVQANTAMLRTGGKRDSYGRSRTRAFRQSFLVSYAIRIGERLAEAASAPSGRPWPSSRPEPRAREAPGPGQRERGHGPGAVPGRARAGGRRRGRRDVRRHPDPQPVGPRTDAEGWTSGRAAADLASLHSHAPVRSEPPRPAAGTGQAQARPAPGASSASTVPSIRP